MLPLLSSRPRTSLVGDGTGLARAVFLCLLAVALAAALLAAVPLGAQPPVAADWSDDFFLTGVDGTVYAMAVHDDGSGPALYAGGRFLAIGPRAVATDGASTLLLRWDGTTLEEIPGPFEDRDGELLALASFDDGGGARLYASMILHEAGPSDPFTAVLARWDGASWEVLSNGTDDAWASAFAVWNDGGGDALWAAMELEVVEVTRRSNPLRAGPTTPLGTFDNEVEALAVYDDGTGAKLYAGGRFSEVDGVPASGLARFDGTSWSEVGGGVSRRSTHAVEALTVVDLGAGPVLAVGGLFDAVGDPSIDADNVALWNGTAWSVLGDAQTNGVDGLVQSLGSFDSGTGVGTALHVGGTFERAGGLESPGLAAWTGSAWRPVGLVDASLSVRAMASFAVDGSSPRLYAGATALGVDPISLGEPVGDDSSPLPPPPPLPPEGDEIHGLAAWNGIRWHSVPEDAPRGAGLQRSRSVVVGGSAVAWLDVGLEGDPTIYVAGGFWLDGASASVARFVDGTWRPLDRGAALPSIHTLETFDDGSGVALYAGGQFVESAAGTVLNRVARWDVDAQAWLPLTDGFGTGVEGVGGGIVDELEVGVDGTFLSLYVGGDFDSVGGRASHGLARWDGSDWWPIDDLVGEEGLSPGVSSLTAVGGIDGPSLRVAGRFSQAGPTVTEDLAFYRGDGEWSAGPGPDGGPWTQLGSRINDVEGSCALGGWLGSGPRFACWNGFAWVDRSAGLSVGRELDSVRIDDRSILVAAGTGESAELTEVPTTSYALWLDDDVWRELLPDRAGQVEDATTEGIPGDRLWLVGDLVRADGAPSHGVALWRPCSDTSSCPFLFADGFEAGDTSEWSQVVSDQ